MHSPDVRRYRATLAYDGTAYQGFQRQAGDIPTIQRAVEQAVHAVSGQPVTVTGAGRTDTGVHATGQVIAFDVRWTHGEEALLRAINANLPDDIALLEIAVARPDFHPRFDALSRLYQYYIIQAAVRQPLLRHRTWRHSRTLDLDLMQAAAAMLLGKHDFAAFGHPPEGDSTVRVVLESRWTAQPEPFGRSLTYRIEANAFLHRMVRRIVGMLVDVGCGALPVGEFERILLSRRIPASVTVAPPQGLVLEWVRYQAEEQVALREALTTVQAGNRPAGGDL